MLERLGTARGVPAELVLDNGPELAGPAIDRGAFGRRVRLRRIERGKRVQNAFVESFHDRPREECLNAHWCLCLADAQRTVEACWLDYNRARPPGALAYRTPEEF